MQEAVRRVIHVTGVTVAYIPHHGDPYVFPAGFAKQGCILSIVLTVVEGA